MRARAAVATGPSQDEAGACTRGRLLDAAEELFALKGFPATSVREITRAGRCNLAAVNYHFGGKHQLYREVFRRRLAEMREERIASIHRAQAEGSGPRALEAVLRSFAAAFLGPLVDVERGWVRVDLWSREMLDPQLPREFFAAEVIGPVQETLASAMRRAVPGLSEGAARLCVQSVIGQLVQVAVRARREQPARDGAAALSRVVEHLVQFSAAGVRACGRRPRAPMRRRPRSHGLNSRPRGRA